jgi:thiol-disulfide isomerase/thioredoxin
MKITNENKPYLIGMVIIAILLVGSLYVLISMMGESVNSNLDEVKSEIEKEKEMNLDDEKETEIKEKTIQECLADFGFNELIYLHSPSCPACRTMTPTVQELVNEGYDIYIADAHQDSNYAKISNCIKDMKGSVPQLICNKNGVAITSTKNKEKIIEIYNEC